MEVLSLPNLSEYAISIRAKALAFSDEKSKKLLERIKLIAPSDASVLVTGESGTGKELISRMIHSMSERADQPFITINCGAFSENLIESELFGHEKGAFTGAVDSRQGWFEAANKGTLFLDEIGDLPLAAQVKLLRVLQEREIVRVGSRKTIKIDVRVIAATNVNLENAVRSGEFREDLYYRLNVAKVQLLPLRERPDDIPPLTRYFLGTYSKQLGLEAPAISKEALSRLTDYAWPGNIRELENVIHYALLVSRGNCIEAEHLQFSTLGILPVNVVKNVKHFQPQFDQHESALDELKDVLTRLFNEEKEDLWQQIEETVFTTAYEYSGKNQLQTSRLLNLSRNIVRARLVQLGVLKLHSAN
jgi:sigma-54-specific transcriptional regulator